MHLPHELGFRTFHGTDCGWASCYRNSTHFHCRTCGFGTSQAGNIISHRRICIPYVDLQQKEFSRINATSESGVIQHEVLQPSQPYSYFSPVTPPVTLPSHGNNSGNGNSKLITTQQSTMFNFVIPTQSPQYNSLYGTQTVFPNSNLFSPSSFNSFGQLEPPWLPQPRLMTASVHSTNSTSDLLGNGRSSFEKLDNSSSPSCCSRIGTIETTSIGMCSPLTAEAYKIVSKEFQSKLDSQNWYCNSQSLMSFNSPTPCKLSESLPSCSISLLLLEQNDIKQAQEGVNVEDICFETKNEDKIDTEKEVPSDSVSSCVKLSKEDINVADNDLDGKSKNVQCLGLNSSNKENLLEPHSVSEESDIVVEESDSEDLTHLTTQSSFLSSRCLVCDKPPPLNELNDFVKINNKMPITTTTTHVSILTKLSQVIGDEKFCKLKNCLICPRCLNLINVVDQLEIKLKSAKTKLLEIYKSKDCDRDIVDDSIHEEKPDSKSAASKRNLNCHICDKQFSSLNYLEKHMQAHTKEFSYYCEYCGKGFAVLQTLQNHIILHSNSSRFQCELCGKRFIQKQNLVDHLKKHKGEYKYQCGVCQKKFIRRSVFKTHLLTHNSEPRICQHCGKLFKNLANLSVHIKICSGDLKFGCDKCEKRFAIRSLLQKHVSVKHNSEYHFSCSICKKGFGKKSDLKTHMKTHSDDKPFKCSKCDNSYKSLSNLNQHLKVHSTHTVLECTICGKKFTRQDCLDDHLNQHTGNKPYKCTTCWKSFANRINFNIHMKRHNGTIKQTPCPVCGKLFSKGLKDHMVSHSGQKPFSCKQCLAVFTVKSSLNKHIKTKHNSV